MNTNTSRFTLKFYTPVLYMISINTNLSKFTRTCISLSILSIVSVFPLMQTNALDIPIVDTFLLSVFPQAATQYYETHFNAWGNDFGWLLFWKWARQLTTPEIFTLDCTNVGTCETLTCAKQIEWFYYNPARWERIRPLDATSYTAWWADYAGMTHFGWFYTDCYSSKSDIESQSIYGYIRHTWAWETYHLYAWLRFDVLTNSLVANTSYYEKTLQYNPQKWQNYMFAPKAVEWIIFDSYWGIASVWDLLSCKFPYENVYVPHGQTVSAFFHNANPLVSPVLDSSQKTCYNGKFLWWTWYNRSKPLNCTLPWDATVVIHWQGTTWYQYLATWYNVTLQWRYRYCRDGYLHGDASYKYGSYTKLPPKSCVIEETATVIPHATTWNLFQYLTVEFDKPNYCPNNSIGYYCDNGNFAYITWSLSVPNLSGSIKNCTIQWQGIYDYTMIGCKFSEWSLTWHAIKTWTYLSTATLSGFTVAGCTQKSCFVQWPWNNISWSVVTWWILSGFGIQSCTSTWCFLSGNVVRLSSGWIATTWYRVAYEVHDNTFRYAVQCTKLDCRQNLCLYDSCTVTAYTQPWQYKYDTCDVLEPQACGLPRGWSLLHSGSVVAYKRSTAVDTLSVCTSEIRTCMDSILSGSFLYPDCQVSALDLTPDYLIFEQIAWAEPGDTYMSTQKEISWLSVWYTWTINISGWILFVNGVEEWDSAFIVNGDVIQVQLVAHEWFGQSVYATIHAWDMDTIFSIKTKQNYTKQRDVIENIVFTEKHKQLVRKQFMTLLWKYEAQDYNMCSVSKSIETVIWRNLFKVRTTILANSDPQIKRENKFKEDILEHLYTLIKNYKKTVEYTVYYNSAGKRSSMKQVWCE